MTEDAALELQSKHIIALKADTALQAYIGQRVFDYIPRDTPYPYVAYFISNGEEWDHSDADGEVHSVSVHVYSDHEGTKEVRKILQVVHELLQDNTTHILTDHNLVNVRRTNKDVVQEDQVYHGIGQYRAVTEEA